MRRDSTLLIVCFIASAGLAAGTYLIGLGWIASLSVLLVSVLLARLVIYLYSERLYSP